MPTVELTDSEYAIILKKRAEDDAMRSKRASVVAVLKVVSDYAAYLHTNSVADTYDTFVTGFGYSGPKPQVAHALCVRAIDAATSAVSTS